MTPEATHSTGDRYGQGPQKKAIGYPEGQPSMFVDGRLLRNIVVTNVRFPAVAFIAGGPWAFGGPLLNVPPSSACYLKSFAIWCNHPYATNLFISLQIWASGRMILGACPVNEVLPLRIHVPPLTMLAFYAYWINLTGAAIFASIFFEMICHTEENDIWEYGTMGEQNPAAAAIPWP